MTIDTACSGSLVAIHEACKALRYGDARQAIVGGTNLILDPERLAVISSMQYVILVVASSPTSPRFFLSDHGRCYAFDSRASGYGRGDGIAAIILKPLRVALADGDTIRSVIRGSSVTSDGRASGITMPSVDAQLDTIKLAYDQAGLDPRDTTYVEAHGTGTQAGDKTEALVYRQTFCAGRRNGQKLFVGSIKANLGHTESTAGLAGLIKTVLIIERGLIPPNINFKKHSHNVELGNWGIEDPIKKLPWPKSALRRASVNSTGYGGTNSHVVLEAYKSDDITCDASRAMARPRLFCISHQREDGIRKTAQGLKRLLSEYSIEENSSFLRDLAFTLSKRRSLFSYRVAVIASGIGELRKCIDELAQGTAKVEPARAQFRATFAFTGQGAQWAEMGCRLLPVYPAFANSLSRANNDFVSMGADWNLLAEIMKPKEQSLINNARLAQPCTTAIQIALVELLQSWDIAPQVVCGHSSGEIAAAFAAGALTSYDALKVAYHRGSVVQMLSTMVPSLSGSMLAVGLSEADGKECIKGLEQNLVVACINSPASITISGDSEAISEVQCRLNAAGTFNRRLDVDVAYHSHYMKHVQQSYILSLADIRPNLIKKGINFVSSVTGQTLKGDELDGEYWARNLVSPVRFSHALSKCLESERDSQQSQASILTNVIIEIGPHQALRVPINQTLKNCPTPKTAIYNSTLKRNEDDQMTVLGLARHLFALGFTIDFNDVNDPIPDGKAKVVTGLSPYSWHHDKIHWHESRRSSNYRFRKFPKHDLLGTPALDSTDIEPMWRNFIRLADLPWLRGHCIQGQYLYPGAGFICMVVEALREQAMTQKRSWKSLVIHFRQIVFLRPLVIPDNSSGSETLVALRPLSYSARKSSTTWSEFRVFSSTSREESAKHCRSLVALEKTTIQNPNNAQETTDDAVSTDPKAFYKGLKDLGSDYSGSSAQLNSILGGPCWSRCKFNIDDARSEMPHQYQRPYCIHPLTLESCFQACFAALKFSGDLRAAQLMVSVEDLKISTNMSSASGSLLCVHAESNSLGPTKNEGAYRAVQGDGSDPMAVVQAAGIVFHTSNALLAEESDDTPLCHTIEWSLDVGRSPAQSIQRHCAQDIKGSTQQLRYKCDPFCRSIIAKALQGLSSDDESKVTGHRSHFLRWMRSQDLTGAQSIDQSFEQRMINLGATGETMVVLGESLVKIVQGNADPLELLLKDDLLYRLYFEDDTLNRCHAQLAKYIRLSQFKTPSMRILELGGGTGSLTIPLVGAIFGGWENGRSPQNSCHYMYTDVSTCYQSFVKDKLKRFGESVQFEKLDIERSPESQGFDLGSFDLIVASNVVHVTKNLSMTLQNLRALLKSEGRLALVELTYPSLRWGFLGGGLARWWLGVDEGRDQSPLLNVTEWNEALGINGFTGVSVEMRDYDSDDEHEVSLMISYVAASQEIQTTQTIHVVHGESTHGLATQVRKKFLEHYKPTQVTCTPWKGLSVCTGAFISLLDESSHSLMSLSAQEWHKVRDVFCHADKVLWVTREGAIECTEPTNSLITGLSRSLRSENHHLEFITFDIDGLPSSEARAVEGVQKVYDCGVTNNAPQSRRMEWEFAMRDGTILIPRLTLNRVLNDYVQDSVSKYHPQELVSIDRSRAFGLDIHSSASIDSLYWVDRFEHSWHPEEGEVQVEMQLFALNFRDVILAQGELDEKPAFLIEGAGVVTEVGGQVAEFRHGDVVHTFEPGGLATTSNVQSQQVFHVPSDVSLEAAAACPLAYATALYGLKNQASIQRGESVLIHSAAGAVGQSAIAIARYYGAKDIFCTIGNAEKRTFLENTYDIPAANIFSSRDLDFGEGILGRTNGRGVDIVLNSLTSDAIGVSSSILAPFGRFIEIGKKDLSENGRLEMKSFAKNATFSPVDLVLLARMKPAVLRDVFTTVFELIRSEEVPVIHPIQVKDISAVGEAFRIMQAGKHIGKFLIHLAPNIPLRAQPPRPKRADLPEDGSYLVVGGTGGLGRVIVQFLAKLGAKHVITLNHSGGDPDKIMELKKQIRRDGTELTTIKGSVADPIALQKVQEASNRPLRGVIQAVMALQDSPLEKMTFDQWDEGIKAKVTGTVAIQAKFGDSLDFFILLGSTGGVIGTYAQSNYNAGNTFLDAFARAAVASRKPVRAIDVGMVTSEGITAQDEAFEFVSKQGLRPHTTDDLMAVIDYAIQNPRADTPAEAQIILGTRRADPDSGTEEAARQRPDAKFSHIWTKPSKERTERTEGKAFDAQAALKAASEPAMAINAALTALQEKLSQLLAIDRNDLQADRSVAGLGIDSLVAIEVRNWVSGRLGSQIQMLELMSPKPLVELATVVAEWSKIGRGGVFGKKGEDESA
ncbi:hypothetical protein ACLMJK_008219 [Lecanora helva]